MLDLVENSIVAKHRDFFQRFELNKEFASLYSSVEKELLKEIFETAHHEINKLCRRMNERLPTGELGAHYWADESRDLLVIIEIMFDLYNNLKGTKYAFEIEEYYMSLFYECRDFLSKSGGSKLPPNHEKIIIYYVVPLFSMVDEVRVSTPESEFHAELKFIGRGSYAQVFKYTDKFYGKEYVLKRALKDLEAKELARFRKEYDIMKQLSSPYIIEVYRYRDDANEYVMECMDETLQKYISRNNDSLSWMRRKGIARQVLSGFIYTQSKNLLHRDISPNNILVKEYDDNTVVVKISDFGLVKTPDSLLTSYNTEIKGVFNDPALVRDGFANYDKYHETYALTLIVYFIMTGETNVKNNNNKSIAEFLDKGMNPVRTERYASAEEVLEAVKMLSESY